MKIRSLLLGLLAGFGVEVSTSAQTLFSAQAVAYLDDSLAGAPLQWTPVSAPFRVGGNTLNEVLPGVPQSSLLLDPQTGVTASFMGNGWSPNLVLPPGQAGLFFNPSNTPVPRSLAGYVPDFAITTLAPGYTWAGALNDFNLIGTLFNAGAVGDAVYVLNNGAYVVSQRGPTSWLPAAPVAPQGTAFAYFNSGATPIQWPQLGWIVTAQQRDSSLQLYFPTRDRNLGTFSFIFFAAAGRRYQVMFTPNIGLVGPAPIGSAILGTGVFHVFTDPTANGPRGTYWVQR